MNPWAPCRESGWSPDLEFDAPHCHVWNTVRANEILEEKVVPDERAKQLGAIMSGNNAPGPQVNDIEAGTENRIACHARFGVEAHSAVGIYALRHMRAPSVSNASE